MKKLLLAIALFAAAAFSKADGLMLDAVQTTGASSAVTVSGFIDIDAQIWSSAGSVATVVIECRSYITAPWFPCFTVTNPDAIGVYYSLPRAFQYRLNVDSWTSGEISGTIVVYSGR